MEQENTELSRETSLRSEGHGIDIIREVQRVLRLEGSALLHCASNLEEPARQTQLRLALTRMYETVERGGKIILTGLGKSGKIAQKIAATLSSTGSFSVYLHPTEALHGDMGAVKSGDVILALSHTGNTEEILRLIPEFADRDICLIGMGGNSQSRLAGLCDVWIDSYVDLEACPHNLAPTSSTTLALALGDAIALTLMQLRGFNPNDFKTNHPGGSLGRKLTLRVKDLMHRGNALPRVGPESSMEEVLNESTEKKLGAVLILQERELLGIITDGDIRRALQKREQFFHLTAEAVMTKKPVTVQSEAMAREAFELMENRSSQIAVLPVLDSTHQCVGIVRLHDLVKNL